MSEPYCVLSRSQIARERLEEYLGAARKRASTYDDWVRCTGFVDTASLQSGVDAWASGVDKNAGATFGDAYKRFRGFALEPSFFRFYYDDASETLHQASLLYSQGASELVEHLSVVRGIADFLTGDAKGVAAVHDPFIGNGTAGVLLFEAGRSEVVEQDAQTKKLVAAMVAELPTWAELEGGGVRDELDSFLTASGS